MGQAAGEGINPDKAVINTPKVGFLEFQTLHWATSAFTER
jgi:hypothetical protein